MVVRSRRRVKLVRLVEVDTLSAVDESEGKRPRM